MNGANGSIPDGQAAGDNGAIHIEVLQVATSSLLRKDIKQMVRSFLLLEKHVYVNYAFKKSHFDDQSMKDNVEKITILVSDYSSNARVAVTNDFLRFCRIHIYRLISDEPVLEGLDEDNEDGEKNNVAAGRTWTLPNAEFDGLWDNLIFDSNIKENILTYVETMLSFADSKVDSDVITSNRMCFFHGPPGTGKTTLCKAVAQKLCIRLGKRYRRGRFLEVNSHSLFSKWFSESGKLVTKLFSKMHEFLEDESTLLVVLIDEVESLTVARKQALSGNEPSDAVRVVNALLTQIDFIRRWPNVLILTTSNLSEAVDPAFLDRADIKQYIGPLSAPAIFHIFFDAIAELRKRGFMSSDNMGLMPYYVGILGSEEAIRINKKLARVANQCIGLSGRTIRKLPLLAFAYKLEGRKNVSMDDFIDALNYAVVEHVKNQRFNSDNGGPPIGGENRSQ